MHLISKQKESDQDMLERNENFESTAEDGRSKKEAFDTIIIALKEKDEINFLFVCSGNICRSPYAEMRFEQVMNEVSCAKKIHVSSGGFTTSYAIHPFTRQTLLDVGIPSERIDRFTPRNMRKHKDELESADLIIAPSKEVLTMIPRKYLDKTFLFSEAISGIKIDIDDPVLITDFKQYKLVLKLLDGYVMEIARILQETWSCIGEME